jgi:hypothetical protein
MTVFYDWLVFFGAWLLFAGPVYQAENELDSEAKEAGAFEKTIHETIRAAPKPDTPSNCV